jgi:hypothetical protein
MTPLLPLLLLLPSLLLADIILYDNHYLKPETPEYLLLPKYGHKVKEVPNWSPGNGRSYIDLSRLTVRSACYKEDGVQSTSPYPYNEESCKEPVPLDILMFEAPVDKAWMDYWEDGNFCCSSKLIGEGV